MSTLRRRKDLEKRAPRAWRKVDKVRVYEDATGHLTVLIGAKWRTEDELLAMVAAKQAFDLAVAPVGGTA